MNVCIVVLWSAKDIQWFGLREITSWHMVYITPDSVFFLNLLLFTHSDIVPNLSLFQFLKVKQKSKHFEESSDRSFPCHYNELYSKKMECKVMFFFCFFFKLQK